MLPLLVGAAIAGVMSASPLLLVGTSITVGAKVKRISDLIQRGLIRPPTAPELALLRKEGKKPDSETILAFYKDELIIAVDEDEIEDTILAELGSATGLPDDHCVALLQHIMPQIREIGLPVGRPYAAANPNKEVLLRAYARGREAGAVLKMMHAEKARQQAG